MYDARKARLKELMEGLLAEYPNVSTMEVAAFWLATRKSIESCLRCCSKSGSTANASCSSAQIETLDDRLACIAIERRVLQLARSLRSRRCVSINYSRIITLSSEECT